MENSVPEVTDRKCSKIGEVYEGLYDQFVDLKHFIYSLTGLHREPTDVALLISKQVSKMPGGTNNAVWLLTGPRRFEETARNGQIVDKDQGRTMVWNSSDEVGRAILDQRVVWGAAHLKLKELFPDFETPILFPIKGSREALGFLVLHQDDQIDTENFQHIVYFASMILEMSDLYFRLENETRERRSLEILLRQERDTLKMYMDIAEVILLALDTDGKVKLINRKGSQLLGCPSEEILGKNWFDCFIETEDREYLRSVFDEILAHDALPKKYVESLLITRTGDKRIIAWRNTRVTNHEGTVIGTLSSGEDITERRRAEQEKEALQSQLFQSQKLEAMGTLVGGIAHDFNNMLQIILGYSQFLLDDKKKGEPGYKELQTIIETGEGGADLVKKLLAFGQQGQAFPVPLDLNRQINQLCTLISRTLPPVVEIDLDLTNGPSTIRADRSQIDQLVMNLAINSSEAMPNGGHLTIATTRVSLDEEYCRRHQGAKPGAYVMLSVTDTGRGIDSQTLARIFDPFFSTKERGATRGTGLGLSVVKGIVQQQGGHITCESEPGKGTAFKIYFPAIEEPVTSAKTFVPVVQPAGPVTILVVEDNIPVAELEGKVLGQAGYTVIVANSGQEALEIFQARKEEISLVILDLLMPEMSGRDCLMELLKIDPSVKVLIASGYAPEDELHREISPLVKGFVHKPFAIAEFLNQARATLDSD